ncbi:hypothetical protein DPMN_154878 [Dreissena polymorpha]|uniref:Uncharacterized protein n=1 Tax=Dreissena polymorpha TaxID=45954 RepID=A0A9D4J659_DREPO|nr:hypothetical protein DPMN_154878 [Dreissena polymorpha]
MLSSILKLNPKYKCMTDQEKRKLITYLTSDGTIETLEGLDLLLLASGEWDTFNHNGSSKYICSETEISMFPGSERKFIAPYERLDKFTKEVMRFICENSKYFT